MGKEKLSLNIQRSTLLVIVLLSLIMALAFLLRTYWAIGPSLEYGYSVSGGSDSYYHERIISYILTSKHHLVEDPMLNYPVGVNNPRPPLFHWAVVLFSYIFHPFMGSYDAAMLTLILFPAIWGTLTTIPVYLLGKEAFNKKVGLIAAFLLAIMPAHLMRSVATQADWDAFDLFFIILMFYFFLKALKSVRYKKWIKSWRNTSEVKKGLREFFQENRTPVIYAALAGASLGSVALAWKGYTYAEAILFIYLIFQLFINRFRNKSNLHVTILMLVFTVVAFTMALPWYAATHRLGQWYGVPLFLMVVAILIGIYFEITARYPWPFVFIVAGMGIAIGAVLISILAPSLWMTLMSGQGYFVKSKLYSTIAEAQPAALGTLAMSFGAGVFILSFFGIIYIIYLIRKKLEEYYLFFVIYAAVAIYMAISAARFMFNAAPAFALTSAVAILWLLEKLKIREAVKDVGKYRGQFRKSLKKSMKFTQIIGVLVIAILVILPNVWSAVDAGIPYETKEKYDKQIYNSLPSFMKPNETTYEKYSPWYFGGFGYSIPKPEYPWPRAWDWLSEQDNSSPPEDRPAFVSWWDYGFEAVREGEHPTIADNFQNGYQIAAQIITAQNESEVIALFIARLLDGDFAKHQNSLSPEVMDQLKKYLGEVDANKIEDVMKNPGKYREEVLDNPSYYGKYESDISEVNTKYVMIKGIIAHHPEDKIVQLYDSIRNITGYDIRYFAVDYRLFPFSGGNTGIFYAPAKLGDRRVLEYGGSVVPYDFYELKAVDEYGNTYDLDKVPMNVHIVNYQITYKPMFFNSMLYRTFIGYSGLDIGKGPYIPGFSQNLSNYPPMQAWNLTHFKLVYKTAYWNPYKDYQNHSDAWKPIPIDLALKYEKEGKGTVDLYPPAYRILPNDVVMVKFYEGAIIKGRIMLSNGEPLQHVRITLYDEYGIPHATVFTDEEGYYSIEAVAGNLTLVVSTNGGLDKLTLQERTVLAKLQVNVSEEQAMRLKPNYIIEKNVVIKPANLNGVVYYDVDHNKKLTDEDIKLNNATLILWNSTYNFTKEVKINNGSYEIKDIPPHDYNIGLIINGKRFDNISSVVLTSGKNESKDIALQPTYIKGFVTYSSGVPAPNATVEVKGTARYFLKTDENGSFEGIVVPDNYTIIAHLGDNYSSPYNVPLYQWNLTLSQNITIRKAYTLSGKITYNGHLAEGALIKIKSELVPHDIYLKEVPKNGSFTFHLPAGIYSLYILYSTLNGKAAYFDVIELNESREMDIALKDAYSLAGYVENGKNYTSIEISIFQGNKFYRIYGNHTGYFQFYLPKGDYQVGFFAFDDKNHPYFGRLDVKLYKNIEENVVLRQTENITGYVYYDSNGDGIREKNETLTDGLILLRDSRGYFLVRNIPPNGNFHLASTSNYQIDVWVYGYKQIDVEMVNEEYEIALEPKLIIVSGNVYREGEINTIPIDLLFESTNFTKIISGITSSYYVELPPGDYTIRISGGNRSYASSYSISLYKAQGKVVKDINFTAYARVTLTTSATEVYWYRNGEKMASGKDVTLPIGDYLLYAKKGNKVAIKNVNIVENTTLSISLGDGYWIALKEENTTLHLPVIIESSEGTLITTSYSILLPSGVYEFVVNQTKLINGIYYHYYASTAVTIESDKTVELYITQTPILTRWNGLAFAGRMPASNAVIQLIALEASKKNVTITTDSDGRFDVMITPGKYMAYSWYVSGDMKYAYLTEITIPYGNFAKTIIYEKGYLLMGSVYLNDAKVSLPLKVETEYGNLEIFAQKTYSLILPKGDYIISAQMTVKEYGLDIQYSISQKLTVYGDTYQDLVLKRNSNHKVELHVMASDKEVAPGSIMHVMLAMENTGNDKEVISIESFSGWTVLGSTKYTLYPGDSKVVSLEIKAPSNARAGNNTVHLRARYGDISDAYLTIYVRELYSSKFNYTVEKWSENALIYNLTVENNGNCEVRYVLSILNVEELRSRGWETEILIDGKISNKTMVEPEKKESVMIKLTAIKNIPGTSTPVKIEIMENGNVHILKIPVERVYVSMTQAYIKAKDVSNYTEFSVPWSWYTVWGLAIAFLMALIILWRRRK